MIMRNLMSFLLVYVTVGMQASVTVVVPNDYTMFTPIGSGFPFSVGSPTWLSFRYQQVYSSGEFAAISQGGGLITGMAFHITSGNRLGVTLPNIQINLSTTFRGP